MKKISLLFCLLITSQLCYGMISQIYSQLEGQVELLANAIEPSTLMRTGNVIVGGSLLLTAFAFKCKKKGLPVALFMPTLDLPFGTIKLKDFIKIHANLPHLMTALLIYLSKNEALDVIQQSGVLANDILLMNAGATILGISNSLILDYYDYYYNKRNSLPLSIKSKIYFDKEFVADHNCVICRCAIEEPINPCEIKEHLFCAQCLIDWFRAKEKNLAENNDPLLYKCVICPQEIIPGNSKVIINRLEFKPDTKDFIRSLAGLNGALLVLLTCNFCYLVFLITA